MERLRGAQILFADDDDVFCKTASFQLERAGAEVVSVANGQEAWDLLQHTKFDCLVTDHQMPILTGHELIRRIRSDARLMQLPIVVVTGTCLEVDPALTHAGMAPIRVLAKPCGPRELLCTVRECLH